MLRKDEEEEEKTRKKVVCGFEGFSASGQTGRQQKSEFPSSLPSPPPPSSSSHTHQIEAKIGGEGKRLSE